MALCFAVAGVALANQTNFILARTGCAKAHCNQAENDAENTGPTPTSFPAALSRYSPYTGFGLGKGARRSEGCVSDGTILACKNDEANGPRLKVWDISSGTLTFIYNSCFGSGFSTTGL
jgi:hypothetical protein